MNGHARSIGLRPLAAAVLPKAVLSVHGENWDVEPSGFMAVRRLINGERWTPS